MPHLKLLSLNLHCLVEDHLAEKQQRIATTIAKDDVDVVLLQEVAQTTTNDIVYGNVKQDNYAYVLQQLLQDQGQEYYLVYHPFKSSFNKYDEGLAILSKHPLEILSTKQISVTSSYHNWKRRFVLVCQMKIEDTPVVLGNTHFGWTDELERFEHQFDQAYQELPEDTLAFLCGDFNIKPTSSEYQHIATNNLIDLFDVEGYRSGVTHVPNMDIHKEGSRIDYIMANQDVDVIERRIVFTTQPVSDHYGVLVTVNPK